MKLDLKARVCHPRWYCCNSKLSTTTSLVLVTLGSTREMSSLKQSHDIFHDKSNFGRRAMMVPRNISRGKTSEYVRYDADNLMRL